MLGLKLNHVSKRGHWRYWLWTGVHDFCGPNNTDTYSDHDKFLLTTQCAARAIWCEHISSPCDVIATSKYHSVAAIMAFTNSMYNWYIQHILDNKFHGANMGPIWGRQDPGGPHVVPMKLAVWDAHISLQAYHTYTVYHILMVLITTMIIIKGDTQK